MFNCYDKYSIWCFWCSLDPVLQKFTMFIFQSKAKEGDENATTDDKPRPVRLRESARILFVSSINALNRGWVAKMRHAIYCLQNRQSQESSNKLRLRMIQILYYTYVRGIDLIAKEFQGHDFCYKKYIKQSCDIPSCSRESQGDFEAEKTFIKKYIALNHHRLYTVKVHEVYNDGQSRKRYKV